MGCRVRFPSTTTRKNFATRKIFTDVIVAVKHCDKQCRPRGRRTLMYVLTDKSSFGGFWWLKGHFEHESTRFLPL
jgi:hypothetical protein